MRNNYIDDIELMFEKCLQINKEICNYKNVRIHYTDVRMSEVKKYDFIKDFIIYIYHNINHNKINWDKMINIYDNNPVKFWKDFFIDLKIDKQIENIPYPEVKNLLFSMKEKVIINLTTLIDVNVLKNLRDSKIYRRNINLLNFFNTFSNIMDIYLFARMFRTFRNIKNRYSESPKYIIIYAGDYHCSVYRELLDELGFEKKYTERSVVKNNNFQCINIENFKQPFFN